MTRSKRMKPPGPDATVEEIQAWMQAQMMRSRNRQEHGRVTGSDRARAELDAQLAEDFAIHAAASRDELKRRGWVPLGPNGPEPWPEL